MAEASGSGGGSRPDAAREAREVTATSLAEALAALRAARVQESQPTRTAAERFEAATRALRAAIRENPMDVRIREAIAELHAVDERSSIQGSAGDSRERAPRQRSEGRGDS